MNRDGQLFKLLSLEYPSHVSKFKSIAFGDGMPASAKWIREGILEKYSRTEVKAKKSTKKPVAKTASPKAKTARKKSTPKKSKGAK
jgi:hypothetical protein